MKNLPFLLLLSIWAVSTASAQIDDFDDGDDAGWTRVEPLAAVGINGSYSFPNGDSYQFTVPATNNPAFGPARAGSLRNDAVYSDFYVSVDIAAFDQTLDQNMGLLARVSDVGIGTLNGYSVTYNGLEGNLFLTVVTDESGMNVDQAEVAADPTKPVRLIFQGTGSEIRADLYYTDDLVNPLASLQMEDSTYASGPCGVFAVSDTEAEIIDVTFDNYFAAESEPAGTGIIGAKITAAGMFEMTFLSQFGKFYAVDKTTDFETWDEIEDGIQGALGDRTVYALPLEAENHFYRFRELP